MIRLNTSTAFKWIHHETDQMKFNKETMNYEGLPYVRHFIPKRFNHFCKILHPMYRDHNVKDENLLWADAPDDDEFKPGDRLWFKDLAKNYNIAYTNEITSGDIRRKIGSVPRYILFADEGYIELEEVERIVSVLRSFTKEDTCYFQYDILKIVNMDRHAKEYLYSGKLIDVLELTKRPHGSPTYWWNASKTWCIYTDFDLTYSIVGGSKEIIDSFLSNPTLECFEIDKNYILKD